MGSNTDPVQHEVATLVGALAQVLEAQARRLQRQCLSQADTSVGRRSGSA